MEYLSNDYRRHKPEKFMRGNKPIYLQICDTLENGRWEGFLTLISEREYNRQQEGGPGHGITEKTAKGFKPGKHENTT